MAAYSGLLGWLGALALLFALVSFLLQLFSGGGALLLSELYWSVGNFVIGIALLAVSFSSNWSALRERMQSGEARRAGKYGSSAILSTLILVGILGTLAFLSTRYHTRWDWTEAQSHSLSSQTLKTLEGLEEPVKVTALYAAIASEPIRGFLGRYTFVSDKVEIEYVDPQAQPGRLAELGVDPSRLEGGLLHVALGAESVEVDEPTEENLTNAIVSLTRTTRKKVYFLIGHNERAIDGEGAEERGGFAFAAEALRNENYEVQALLLASASEVPADADVVVVAGPTRPYHESEHAALTAYLERGGALLVLLDPRANTDLYDDLRSWGIDVGDDVVVDRVQGLFGRPTTPFAAEYADHPITVELRDATMFHTARSVQPLPEAEGGISWIVRTGPQSWAERDMERLTETGEAEPDDLDLAGPVPLAVAGNVQLGEGADAATQEGARIVVVGDSDFATNQLIREFRNRDFLVNSVNWLLGDVEAISIRPTDVRASRLQLSSEQYLQIRYLSLFVLPEAIAALGVFAWWSRRRAPGR